MVSDAARKVKVGFFSFTEITDAAGHRAYNEWHMFDHMPEQFPLPGVVFGQRWVLTPERRAAARLTSPFDRIHYVTLYLLADPVADTLDEFFALGAELHAAPGRWFDARRSHVAGPWRLDAIASAPRVAIRAEAIPARPHRALRVVVGQAAPVETLCATPGVAGAWRFTPDPVLASRRRGGVDEPITLAWIDGESAESDVESDLEAVRCSAILEPITPWQWDWFDRDVPDRGGAPPSR
jgi:hypothetical protein